MVADWRCDTNRPGMAVRRLVMRARNQTSPTAPLQFGASTFIGGGMGECRPFDRPPELEPRLTGNFRVTPVEEKPCERYTCGFVQEPTHRVESMPNPVCVSFRDQTTGRINDLLMDEDKACAQ